VVIRRSSAREIDALIGRLDASGAVDREGAIARLRVIGARAVPRLIDAVAGGSNRTRLAAIQALEGLRDPRGVTPLLRALDDRDPLVAAAAASALSPHLGTASEPRIIDTLTTVILDAQRDARARRAALASLAVLGAETIHPILERLGSIGPIDESVRRLAEEYDTTGRATIDLPGDPADLRRMLGRSGGQMSIVDLHRIVTAVRGCEAKDVARRAEWMTARAVAHQILAGRGSRVALYDLRETLEGADGPLPVEFLAAVEAVGDVECAAAMAGTYARACAASGASDWWARHLATAFRAIVRRERITRRDPALQRAARRWPEAVKDLMGRPRPTQKPQTQNPRTQTREPANRRTQNPRT
jgi:HEAT repeat protein